MKSLRESEEKFRTVADYTYDWETWVAPDRSMLYVSPSCECITGYRAEEFAGDPGLLHRIVHPEDRPWFDVHIRDCLEGVKQGEEHEESEFRIVRSDGELRWIGHVCTPVFGVDGTFRGRRGSNRDITERKRSEREKALLQSKLQETTKQLGLSMDAAELGVWEWDVPSDQFTIGEHFSRALGYTPDEFGQRLVNWSEIVHPEDLPKGMERLVAHLKGETPLLEVEHRSRTKSGEWKWFQIRGKVTDRGPDGKALRLSGISVNITEKKIAEEALRKSEEQHRFVLDNLKVVVFRSDTEWRWSFLNPAWTGLTGFDVQESLGKYFLEFVFPEDREGNLEMFRPLIERKKDFCRHEVRYLRKDGGVRWVEAWALLTHDEQGNTTGAAGTLTDITERKRAEEEKDRLQGQLQQAMKMEAVGRLAGGVAHDFNNLLTVIIGNVSLALGKVQESAPIAGMLSEVNKAAERAARLTQQLLAFSRKQLIEPKILDLNQLITGLHTMLVRLIGEHIELRTLPGVDLGPVKVDPGQFEQILVNLAVNARDAMPEGGKLLIETGNADLDEEYCARHPYVRPGRFVMLAVSDTGHGMTEEVRRQIFEPFFTTKPKGTGTGLGLATIYGVVKQAEGSIEVYSEIGKGTTFKIYIPRVEGEAAKPRESDLPMEKLVGSETVLLVEDEEIVRKLCVRILESFEYKVMQASNGDEAIALAWSFGERIDLLMTDVVMPGMHGRELANRLTRIHPEMKVLFTSGYTDDAIVHHGVLDEGVSFIGKPYSPWALAKKVREVLDTT
jgi:PAS domain S-box-containing protein